MVKIEKVVIYMYIYKYITTIKKFKDVKEQIQPFLLADDMIFNTENPKESTKIS